ncbi:F-box/kelch-repeat protein-like protein [Tanacetum coccineum]
MSDHMAFDIQEQIIKKLPVKSLIRFRSVSKRWKSLIGSSEFIANYNVCQAQPQRLLISYKDYYYGTRNKFISIEDDETFTQHKFSLTHPQSANSLTDSVEVGCSHGLFCFYSYDKYSKTTMAFIWNPSIRKSVAINVSGVYGIAYEIVVGFGICPLTLDPKIIMIPQDIPLAGTMKRVNCLPTLNTGSRYINLIISFDLSNEEFREIHLPESLLSFKNKSLSISKLRESLVVLEYNMITSGRQLCAVWMLDNGVPNSFTQFYTINAPDTSLNTILGFTKSGAILIERQDNRKNDLKQPLALYEPDSKHITETGIFGKKYSFLVHSYMETLLLLD